LRAPRSPPRNRSTCSLREPAWQGTSTARCAGADFPGARRLRRLFEDTYGASPETLALGFLDALADALTSPLPEEALTVWPGLDSGLETHPRLRLLLRVFGRLLRSRSVDDLVSLSPGALPALA